MLVPLRTCAVIEITAKKQGHQNAFNIVILILFLQAE